MSTLPRGELEWIERYANHLSRERRLSEHTTSNYRRDLRQFADHLVSMGIKRWPKVDTFHVQTFAAQLHRKGMAPRTVQRRLSALRGFFEYLIREEILKTNPARDVRAPQAPKRLPLTLDADQMQRLLEITGDDPLVIRDRAMMELMYSSGLRLAELVGLEPGDIDANDGTVRVTGKGDKTRVVPVGRLALAAVKSWLDVRAQLADADEPALFVGRRGGRISRRQVQHRVRHWANRQGIPIRVFPHLFRHSFATHMLESSGDLRAVQELLGHANISTTQIYTHLDFQHLARVYDEAHPRARKRSRDD